MFYDYSILAVLKVFSSIKTLKINYNMKDN